MNYPTGSETDPAAPWNEPRIAGRYLPHYILIEVDGLDVQYEVNFPECCDSYDLWKLSKAWARDKGAKFIDHSTDALPGITLIAEGECYE
jgi:hypothetical protein